MSAVGLAFLRNEGGEAEGLMDAGIETFRDSPFAAVAREMGQNSRDAQDDSDLPVRVTFDVLDIPRDEFPAVDTFVEAISLCRAKAEEAGNEKEKGFFEHAAKTLQNPTIRLLRISDFNTTGVAGPCEEGTPFHTLPKSDGVSVKQGRASGGSFGIGKNAVFAVSDIQTAFFSTRYHDAKGAEQVLCMGKTLLRSHRAADGTPRRRKGYWGRIDGFEPLDRDEQIPQFFRRDSLGTSIFAACMREGQSDWRYEILVTLIVNFFRAVECGDMEFEIDHGSIKLNRRTIQGLLHDERTAQTARDLNLEAALETAGILYRCSVDEKTQRHTLDIPELGTVNVQVLLREKTGYTVGIVRNGMYITDKLGHFGESFKRFPLYREFAALVEPDGSAEGEWFKRLENPRHDDLSAERITDPALRARGERLFRRLAKELRALLKSLAREEAKASTALDELSEFFAAADDLRDDELGSEPHPKAYEPSPIEKRERKPPKDVRRRQQESVDNVPAPAPEGDGTAAGGSARERPQGPDTRAQPRGRSIDLQDTRNILAGDVSKATHRRVFFTSPESGNLQLRIFAAGLNDPEPLSLVHASTGSVSSGLLRMNVVQDSRVDLTVEFAAGYAGPIEIEAVVEPYAEVAA